MQKSTMLTIFLLSACATALQITPGSSDSLLALGETASLSEDGYQKVAALKSDSDMKSFMQRLLEQEGRQVVNEAEFNGIVPFYSGEKSVQSFKHLKHELEDAAWVDGGLGRSAELSEQGYRAVALGNAIQMKAFARRIAHADGKKITDESKLNGILPYYNGEASVQSFAALQQELRSAPWVQSVGDWEEADGNDVPLTEEGYQRVAKTKSDDMMKTFVRRVLLSEARFVKEEAGLSGFVPFYSGKEMVQNLEHLKTELRASDNAWWVGDGVGRTAELSDAGFSQVVAKKSDANTKAFGRRLLKSYGATVSDEGALSGLVPYFSGKAGTDTFEHFHDALLRSQGGARTFSDPTSDLA